jgi:hypothetical protein
MPSEFIGTMSLRNEGILLISQYGPRKLFQSPATVAPIPARINSRATTPWFHWEEDNFYEFYFGNMRRPAL